MKNLILFFITVFFVQSSKSQNGLCLISTPDPSLGVFSSPALDKADFNNDGKEDICSVGIMTNSPSSGNTIRLFLSTGTGSFSTSDFTLNSQNTSGYKFITLTKACDFNNDGKQDIFALQQSDSIFLLLGTGAGSFNVAVSFSVPYSPTSLITSDFNSDGKIDVAISSNSTHSLSVLLGNGTGGFSSITHYNLASNAKLLVAGDFNNNGTLDIFAMTGGPSYFLKGGGNGTFTLTNGPSLGADDVKAVDVNSDNKLDLVYTNISNNTLNIINGNGNFSFGALASFSVTQIGGWSTYIAIGPVHTGDFNKDGKVDIAVISNYIGISIFQGIGNGAFASPVSYSVNQTGDFIVFNFIIADINNDTKPDIVALADNGGTIPYGEVKIFMNCNTVGLKEETKKESHINLFPNPANDFLTLEFSNEQKNDFKKISIYNEFGQLVKEEKLNLNESNYVLKLNGLSAGVYFLQLTHASTSLSITEAVNKRFVISR